jgi:hypothetical protein
MALSAAAHSPPRSWLLLCCLLVAVLAAYIPVLGGGFVWDDHHLIEDSPLVQELRPLPEYFAQGFWRDEDPQHEATYYRPLAILSLAVDKKIFGDNSGGFHLTNLLFHLLSTSLLFRLLRARNARSYAALLGTALWALFPRLTEAVAWISGRTDVLATFFVLAALVLARRPAWLARLGTALLLLLGLLCKEVAVAGVAYILVTGLCTAGTTRERLTRTVPVPLCLLAYGALRVHAVGFSANESDLALGRRLLAAAASVGHYTVMLVTPWFPDIQIGRLYHPKPLFIALGCVVLAALLLGLVRHFTSLSADTLSALTLTGVAFAVVLHVIPFSVKILAADRFLYLPLVGLT